MHELRRAGSSFLQRSGLQRRRDREVPGSRGGHSSRSVHDQGRVCRETAPYAEERVDMVDAWIDGRAHVPKLLPNVSVPVLSVALWRKTA